MADPKAAMAALQQKYAAYSAETTKAGAAMRALVQKYGDGTKGANGFSGGTTKDPILTSIVNAPKAENKPIANIKAFGADGSGAARTGLAVGAGVKQSAASYLNLAGAFTPGNLTIGEEVRAGNTEAERQKAMQDKRANTQEKVYGAADKLADSAQADIEKANEGASKFGKTLNSVATAGTQLIGDIGMSAIAPGSGLWAMGARTFGSSAQEARRNGATENRQFAYAAANAAVEVLTEKLFGGLISGEEGLIAKGLTKTKGGRALVNLLRNNGGTKLVQDVVDKVSQKAAGRIAVDTIKNFAGEGFEEFVSGVAQPLLDSIYNGKGISENYSELDWQNVLEEVMVGGILGVIGGGVEGVVRPNNIGGTQAAQESVPNAAAQRTNTAEGNLTAEAQSAATAQETASTAIGNAVSAVRDGGTVTNSVAERIISTDGALAQLGVDPNGKTASQLRGAVKDAIAQMAASEATTAQQTAQQTAQPMNEGIAAAGLMVNGQPGITPPGVETRNSLDTNQAVPYTENRTQNVFGGVMNGAENGAGISGNAERGIPGNKDMAAYSGDAGGYTGERGVGNAGQLLSTSRVIADNEGGTSAYSAWLNEARQSDQKNGWAVTPKEPSDLVGATMRVFGDGAAGYAVKDGDLEAVFKNKNKTNRRNLFEDILPQAIADGAVKGDCYGENLARLYAHSGAIPVARVEFNEAYANDGWTPDKGRPDIYMLMFSGDDADTVRAKQGTYHIPTVEELKALPFFDKDGYDQAAAYRDRLLEQRRTSTQQSVEAATPDNLGSARAGFDPLSRAEIEYGTQDGSANAVRPDDMPVSTNGVNRVSESAVTVKGAAVTPDEFVPLLERSVMDNSAPNGLRYMPITNDATVQSAMDTISTEGWESALNQWQKDVSAGRVSEKITAMGAILYNHAVNSGNTQLALDIISDYAANGRAAARGLQAMRILQTLTPDSRLYMIQRSLNKMAEDMNLPDGIKISEETMQEYRDAQTEEARDAAIDKMQGEIADQLWQTRWAEGRKLSTLKNKWNALRYVNMLGNFKTPGRNYLGNVGMTAMTRAKDAVAAGVEALASAATGGKIERTKSAFVDRGLLNAAKADFANVEQQAMGESRYSLNEGRGTDATGIVRGAQDKAQVFRFKPLEAYRKATNYAMEKGDVIFSKANYARALAGWLQAHGITAAQMNDPAWRESNTELLDRGRAYAIKEAQESTFRDSNAVSSWISKAGRGENTPKAVKVLGEGLMPFRKTPANVLVRAEEYSPLGIVNTAVLAAQKAKGNTDITGADIINQASKALTGTGVFLLGMALRNAGLLRGGEDEDKDQQYFDQLTGHQDYSLELPDGTSYTLDWITPGSIPLFMGSAMADAVADGGFQLRDLGEAFTKITDPMLEMSMLSGVNDALDSIKNSKDNLPQLAISLGIDYLTQGLTNTMLGQLERIGETERMTYYTDKNSALPDYIQKKLSKASAKIPGWDYQQREWVDAWGQTESTGGLGERVLTNMFSPGYVSKVDIDSVEKELQRLADATGSTTIFPDIAEKSITVNGETIYLDSDKYLKYAKQKGQESAKLCKKLMDSAGYKALSDEDKVDAVRKAYEYATAGAKEKVSDYRVGDSSWINKARSNPMPIQDYIVAYEKYGGSAGIEKQQKIAAAAKQTGMAVDSFTKLKEAESAAVKAKNANSDTNHSRWTKKELMGYIEKNYPKNQWNNVFNTYKSYSNLNWKNPY